MTLKQNFFEINFKKISFADLIFAFKSFVKEYSITVVRKNRETKLVSRFAVRIFIEVSSILLKSRILFNYRLPEHCFSDFPDCLIGR